MESAESAEGCRLRLFFTPPDPIGGARFPPPPPPPSPMGEEEEDEEVRWLLPRDEDCTCPKAVIEGL